MALSHPALAAQTRDIAASAFSSGDKGLVAVVGLVAVIALVFSFLLFREVLSADQGTPKMIEIAEAVQEGAQAYLKRQFRTLSVVVVVVFLLLFALPADDTARRRILRLHRLLRHVAGNSRQPAGSRGCQ